MYSHTLTFNIVQSINIFISLPQVEALLQCEAKNPALGSVIVNKVSCRSCHKASLKGEGIVTTVTHTVLVTSVRGPWCPVDCPWHFWKLLRLCREEERMAMVKKSTLHAH